ncbi:MAG TPA: nuclear transport factor 2 family protein [Actinoplanes sp.]
MNPPPAVVAAVLSAADRLSAAFAARDVDAALDCFVVGDHIGYAGSERAETATGRDAVSALFTAVFARDEAYSWRVREARVHAYSGCAYLFAEADGVARTDAGETVPFSYRISGVLEKDGGRWRWRHCQGAEPTA